MGKIESWGRLKRTNTPESHQDVCFKFCGGQQRISTRFMFFISGRSALINVFWWGKNDKFRHRAAIIQGILIICQATQHGFDSFALIIQYGSSRILVVTLFPLYWIIRIKPLLARYCKCLKCTYLPFGN